jgi:hypothetical protein
MKNGTPWKPCLKNWICHCSEWRPETATQVRQVLAELIDLADYDVLDLLRSRVVEQEVLRLIDEPTSG